MKLALDVFYRESGEAKVVGVGFTDWKDNSPSCIISCICSTPGPYVPGEFYRRELPCLLELVPLFPPGIDTFLIDGFVWLPGGKKGLGAYWSDYFPRAAVIGVAKNSFVGCEEVSEPVIRGASTKPLWVGTNGRPSNIRAAEYIKGMYGSYRIPDLLKILDKKTKTDEKATISNA